jgi:hypothetical protein
MAMFPLRKFKALVTNQPRPFWVTVEASDYFEARSRLFAQYGEGNVTYLSES